MAEKAFLEQVDRLLEKLKSQGVDVTAEGISKNDAGHLLEVLGADPKNILPHQQYFLDNAFQANGEGRISTQEIANVWQAASTARTDNNRAIEPPDVLGADGVIDYLDITALAAPHYKQFLLNEYKEFVQEAQTKGITIPQEQIDKVTNNIENLTIAVSQGTDYWEARNGTESVIKNPYHAGETYNKIISNYNGFLAESQARLGAGEETDLNAQQHFFGKLAEGNAIYAITDPDSRKEAQIADNQIFTASHSAEKVANHPHPGPGVTSVEEYTYTTTFDVLEKDSKGIKVVDTDASVEKFDPSTLKKGDELPFTLVPEPDVSAQEQNTQTLMKYFYPKIEGAITPERVEGIYENMSEAIATPEAFDTFVKERIQPIYNDLGFTDYKVQASETDRGFLFATNNFEKNQVHIYRNTFLNIKKELEQTGTSPAEINETMAKYMIGGAIVNEVGT